MKGDTADNTIVDPVASGVDGASSRSQPTVPAEVVAEAATSGNRQIAQYLIVRELGQGGAGTVYAAWDRKLGRWVALKLLHRIDENSNQLFLREARTAARLTHPNIIPIYEAGEEHGRPFLTMRLIEGKPLSKVRLDIKQSVSAMRDVADAVQYAHEIGVIHRDLKPHNLMLADSGLAEPQVFVMDFGLAHTVEAGSTLTATGAVVGTPAYMPPEQARGERCDVQSDVYALGATLYHLLSGRAPFDGDNALWVMTQVLADNPPSLSGLNRHIPKDLLTIVDKAMEKVPAARYPTARALAEDLARFQRGEPIEARPVGSVARVVKWSRRHKLASAFIATVVLGSIAFGLGALQFAARIAREQNATQRARIAADRARTDAEAKLASSLLAQAHAAGSLDRWTESIDLYSKARDLLGRTQPSGLPAASAELGRADAVSRIVPPLMTLTDPSGPIETIALSNNGTTIFTAGRDGQIRKWETPTGRKIAEWTDPEADAGGGISQLAHGEGWLAVIWRRGAIGVTVFSSDDGRIAWRVPTAERPASIALDNGGTMVAIRDYQSVQLRVASTGKLQATFELKGFSAKSGQEIRELAFSPDGRALAIGFNDDRHVIWDTVHDLKAEVGKGEAPDNVAAMALSSDAQILITASADGRLSYRHGRDREGISRATHPLSIRAVHLDPRGDKVLVVDRKGAVLHRLPSLAAGPRTPFDGYGSISIAGSRPLLASTSQTGSVVFRAFRSEDFDLSQTDYFGHPTLSFDDRLIAHQVSNGFYVRDVATKKVVHVGNEKGNQIVLFVGEQYDLAIATNLSLRIQPLLEQRRAKEIVAPTWSAFLLVAPSRNFLTATGGNGVNLWTFPGLVPVLSIPVKGGDNGSRVAAFSPDSALLIAAANDRVVRVDLKTLQWTTSPKLHANEIKGIAFLPDGKSFLTASHDALIKQWDVATGTLLRTYRGHTGEIRSVSIFPNGKWFLTSAKDLTVRIWDVNAEQALHTFIGHRSFVDWSGIFRDGRTIVSTGRLGDLRLWDLKPTLERDAMAFANAYPRLSQAYPDPEALIVAARWYARFELWDWAADLLERARKAGQAVSPLELARLHWQAGNLPRAAEEFQAAIDRKEAPETYLRLCLRAVTNPPSVTP